MQDVAIYDLVTSNQPVVFVFSCVSKKIKTKLKEKRRIIVNVVILQENEFWLRMFSLTKGQEIDLRISYEEAM